VRWCWAVREVSTVVDGYEDYIGDEPEMLAVVNYKATVSLTLAHGDAIQYARTWVRRSSQRLEQCARRMSTRCPIAHVAHARRSAPRTPCAVEGATSTVQVSATVI